MTTRTNPRADARPLALQALGHVLCFGVGLLGVSRLIHDYDWRGLYSDVTLEKVQHLIESDEQYDTLFVGSSRMYAGVIPATFDAEMADQGLPTHSFNAADCAMGMHEANALLRDLCERMPNPPKRVVVELHWWDPVFRAENHRTTRAVGWHSLGETLSVLRSIALPIDAQDPAPDFAGKITLVQDHLRCLVGNLFRVGQGVRILKQLWSPSPSTNGVYPEELERGYCELGKTNRWGRRARNRFVSPEGQAEYADLVETAKHWDRSQKGFNIAAFKRQADYLQSRGIDLIYMVAPTVESKPGYGDLEIIRRRVPVLVYDQPLDVPEYFATENRFDTRHLNRSGGVSFSRRLAADCAREWGNTARTGSRPDQPSAR